MTALTHMLADVAAEVERAAAQHPDYASLHEGYAVLLEEVDEFWDLVKLKASRRDPAHVYEELTQIAAVAIRIAIGCGLVVVPPPPSYTEPDSGGQLE